MTLPTEFQPTKDQYWHYVAATCGSPIGPLEIQEVVNRIVMRASGSFELRAGPNGQTPGHVAVTYNNRGVFEQLLMQGIWLTRQDVWGVTIGQCMETRGLGEFLEWQKICSLPRVPNPKGVKILGLFLKKYLKRLEQGPCTYQGNSDDFGIIIKKLLIANLGHGRSFYTNMQHVCSYLGIEIESTEVGYYPRDAFYRRPDGSMGPQLINKGVEEEVTKALQKSIDRKQDGFAFHPYPLCTVQTGATAQNIAGLQGGIAADVQRLFPKTWKKMIPLVIDGEGGNRMIITDRSHEPMLLLARIERDTSHLLLRRSKTFKMDAKESIQTFDPPKIARAAREMYVQGLLKIGGQSGFVEGWLVLWALMGLWEQRRAQWPVLPSPDMRERINILRPGFNYESNAEKIHSIAVQYLKEKELVKNMTTVGYGFDKKEDIIFLPTLLARLDLFMLPGPNKTMFVADFEMAAELLRFIKKYAGVWSLSSEDKKVLDIYISSIEGIGKVCKPILEKIQRRLKERGIETIPTPGLFLYDDPSFYDIEKQKTDPPLNNINFMNGVTGFSKKTGRYFFITGGAATGNHLGQLLMDVFTLFLKQYVPNIDVFFVGHSEKNPTDFSEAMAMNTRLTLLGGIRRLVIPLETKTHTA